MEYSKLWLDYKPIDFDFSAFKAVYRNSDDRTILTAARELQTAISEMGGTEPELVYTSNAKNVRGIFLNYTGGTEAYYNKHAQAYRIKEDSGSFFISSQSAGGVLRGAFDLIRRIRCGERMAGMDVECVPDNPLRMLNHWDNMDGTIERGYSGKSFFFGDGDIILNDRTRMYARLAASVGINAVVINNVNVDDAATALITPVHFRRLRELSGIFCDYGIRLFLSVNYAAPMSLGGTDTADPLDGRVIKWWRDKADELYRELPLLGGFLIKADSEGRPGPHSYGRTQADGANMLARALAPHGGTLIWRCFVYDCHRDWRDRRSDRARDGYEAFFGLDGRFESNVILQIKNGPVDFQVREPVSPLFCAMPDTNIMLEVQIAQEYTGQQIDLCYLIPWFREILSFKMRVKDVGDTVADYIQSGDLCGMAAVCNTGNDYNWTGHDLAAANLYGFGRLSSDTSLSAEGIAEEWIKQTYGGNGRVTDVIRELLMNSHRTYEKYTAPLGVGWMVSRETHYGPDIDGYEYSRWGTYHYADREGIGVDRTRNGTNYVSQYSSRLRDMYENTDTCPDNLILFFHHLPYTYRLKSGKTIIQHIYDTHFEGVSEVEEFAAKWMELEPYIDRDAHKRVRERFCMQLKNAVEWRDTVNTYFYRKSGAEDEKHRRIYP